MLGQSVILSPSDQLPISLLLPLLGLLTIFSLGFTDLLSPPPPPPVAGSSLATLRPGMISIGRPRSREPNSDDAFLLDAETAASSVVVLLELVLVVAWDPDRGSGFLESD